MYTCDFVLACAFEPACVHDLYACVHQTQSSRGGETEIEQERRIYLIEWKFLVRREEKNHLNEI